MAASTEDVAADAIVIKLTADDNIKELRERSITLTRFQTTAAIGRASKVSSKGFTAAADNCFFDSPVMSRHHAELVGDIDDKTVFIRDVGSLHGTFLNNNPDHIEPHQLREIRDGSTLTFGIPIWRNSESFQPASIGVRIKYETVGNQRPITGSTFAVPEFVDDDSSSSDDEDDLVISHSQVPSKPDVVVIAERKNGVELVDLTDSEMDQTTDNLIDLTSPPRAKSPESGGEEHCVAEVEKILNASSTYLEKHIDNASDIGDHASDIEDNASDIEDTDIRASSSHDSAITPESIQLSDDEEDSHLSDCDDRELDMDEDSLSSDDEDEDLTDIDDEVKDWDVEYSSDEDVLDGDDPDTAVWGAMERPTVPGLLIPYQIRLDDESSPKDAPTAQATLRSMFDRSHDPSATRVSLPSLLNPERRPASPSDAALAKCSEHLHSVLPVGLTTTAEALGQKTGKHEYFAARAENRLRALGLSLQSHENLQRRFWVPGGEKTQDLSRYVSESTRVPTPVAETIPIHVPAPADATPVAPVPAPAAPVPTAAAPIPTAAAAVPTPAAAVPTPAAVVVPNSFAANQTVAISPLLQKGDRFLNRPPPPASNADFLLPTYPGEDVEEPISAYELQKRKAAALKLQKSADDDKPSEGTRRTQVGIPDLVDWSSKDGSPWPTAWPMADWSSPRVVEFELETRAPAACEKGKRKADEISDLTESEKQWEESESRFVGNIQSMRTRLPATDRTRRHPTPPRYAPKYQRDAPKHVRFEEPLEVRAPKRLRLRKIAERLGYAALGGATVGAALVSTLIYTAPTFT